MTAWNPIGLFLVVGSFALSLVLGSAAVEARAPNVILIMADDLGYECIGAYGGTSYETPHIDQLAETGIRFENAHAQPICTPTRVQIMTGKYNVRNYVKFANLDPSQKTFGNLFKEAGYKTCMVGKWQLGGGLKQPGYFGFDNYCMWRLVSGVDNISRYPNPGLAVDGEYISYQNGEYGPDVISDYAGDFIETNKDQPFFLYYSMLLVHNPFEPTPQSGHWDPKAVGLDNIKGSDFNNTTHFPDMMNYMDKEVGKLVAKLEELGLRENTVIIFTGDNGTTQGVTSLVNGKKVAGGKGLPTDAGTHVPLIANCPGVIPAGQVSEDLVDVSDILPTVCDIGRVPIPEPLHASLDGRSFFPQMKGEKGNSREWVYCWYQRRIDVNEIWESVRNVRYKLYADGNFYDLEKDILELEPLDLNSLTEEQEAIRKQFRQVIDDYAALRPEALRAPNKKPGYHRQKRRNKK